MPRASMGFTTTPGTCRLRSTFHFTPSIVSLFTPKRLKVRSNLAREYEEGTHHGITTEVLEFVVQEAALREVGELERADSVQRKAVRTR